MDELIGVIKAKEEVTVNVITDVDVNDVNFLTYNNYNPNWKRRNYASNLSRSPYLSY